MHVYAGVSIYICMSILVGSFDLAGKKLVHWDNTYIWVNCNISLT